MKAFTSIILIGFVFGPAAHAACDLTLSPGANVSSAVATASPGTTICLNSGTYSGLSLSAIKKNPRVTVRSASGRSAVLNFTLQNGTSGINLDSLTLGSGDIVGATTRDITVSNSDFKPSNSGSGKLRIDGPIDSNILLDHNTHNNILAGQQELAGRVSLPYGSLDSSGVTIQNSEFDGGCADGIQSGIGLNIFNNRFTNIRVGTCPNDPHTDAIQFVFHSGAGPHIRGNYFFNNDQVLTAFDRVANAVIEHNVFDSGPAGRPWQIEWYSDTNSIIRHNTIVYSAKCAFNMECGAIYIGHKSADPAGKGTVVVDNIATSIQVADGSTVARQDHNLVRRGGASGDFMGSPVYLGGTAPATWNGFQLTPASPGYRTASDGMDIGSNDFGTDVPAPVPEPAPQPVPAPGPSDLDVTAPETAITTPVDGTTIRRRSTFIVSARAVDNREVTKVEFYKNGRLVCTDSTAPYMCSMRAPGQPGRVLNLNATAYDAAGNAGGSSIRIRVK